MAFPGASPCGVDHRPLEIKRLAASLQWLAGLDPGAALPDRSAENASLRSGRRDCYYDLSRRETDRLETPFWVVPDAPGETVGQAFERLASQAERILAGEQVFRPLAVRADTDPFEHIGHGVQRGGNTFVLDVEALRLAPNPAPVVDGRPSRRSDMLWALLQKRCFGRRVRTLPIAAYQDRSRVRPGSLDLERIVDDIRGYAMYSALDDTGEVLAADGSHVRVTEDGTVDSRIVAISVSTLARRSSSVSVGGVSCATAARGTMAIASVASNLRCAVAMRFRRAGIRRTGGGHAAMPESSFVMPAFLFRLTRHTTSSSARAHSVVPVSKVVDVAGPLREWLEKAVAPPLVRRQGISPAVAAELAALPASFHRDPADRILVATARLMGATLLTQDRRIVDSGLAATLR